MTKSTDFRKEPSQISYFDQTPNNSKEKVVNIGAIAKQGSVSSIQFVDAGPAISAQSSKMGILKGSSRNMNLQSTRQSSDITKLRSILHRASEVPN